jgi:hypothetical protein
MSMRAMAVRLVMSCAVLTALLAPAGSSAASASATVVSVPSIHSVLSVVRFRGHRDVLLDSIEVYGVAGAQLTVSCEGCLRYARRIRVSHPVLGAKLYRGVAWILEPGRAVSVKVVRKHFLGRYLLLSARLGRQPRLVYERSGCLRSLRRATRCPHGIVLPKKGDEVPQAPPAPTTYPLAVTVSGQGTVSGPGISCPGTCSHAYAPGTVVTLTAAAGSGYHFAGWTGACSGEGPCQVTVTQSAAVGAAFTALPLYTFDLFGTGSGAPELGFVLETQTGTGTVEPHWDTLQTGGYKRAGDFGSDFSPADAPDGVWQLFGSGTPELGFIKLRDDGSGTVEVHWDTLQTGGFRRAGDATSDFTPADASDGVWQLFGSVNGAPELGFIKLSNDGSGTVEVHWDTLQNGVYKRAGDATSDFSPADAGDGVWQLFGSGTPELGFIKLRNTGSGTVEVHWDTLQTGGFKRAGDATSDFSPADAGNGVWQLVGSGSGAPELGFIKTRDLGSGTVEVHWDTLQTGGFERAGDATSDFSPPPS